MLHLIVQIHARKQAGWFRRLVNPEVTVMPRNRKYIPEIQDIRREQRNKRTEKSDGPAYLQFIGSGANGAPRSLYFFTEYCRYVFNVGEGTQRLAHEHKIKISRLEHIFITQAVWKNIGGLLGFGLTLQECGVPEVTLHGPNGVAKIYEAADRFVYVNNLKINMANCSRGMVFSDPMVTIEYVPLIPIEKDDCVKSIQNSPECTSSEQTQQEDPALLSRPEGSETYSSTAMSYICRMKSKLGRLNLEKCVEKNVPPGPMLGKLKTGLDVTLEDGTIVRAVDVKDPDEPGAVFIIVDCPTKDYIESLVNERLFKNHQIGAKAQDIPKYIVHFTPPSVMRHEKYQEWMKRFDKSSLQVNANSDNKCMGFVGTHEIQYKLNLIDKSIFPLLKDDSLRNVYTNIRTEEEELEALLDVMRKKSEGINPEYVAVTNMRRKDFGFPDHEANTLRCLPIRDEHAVEKIPDCVFLTSSKFTAEVTRKKEFQEEMIKLRSNLELIRPYYPEREYPRVTFLGTGSCIPNKCRNASAILVSMAYDNHIILDCGEGTYGQLVRHFGPTRTTEILSRTNIIFVSHIHADHHLGFIDLLRNRSKAVKNVDDPVSKVILIGPKTMRFWLKNYENLFENIFDDTDFIECQCLEYRSKIEENLVKVKSVAPLEDMTTAYVNHCPYAFGIAFTHTNGTKITYSGDTMPAKTLVNIGMNSNLLIHEATFEDELVREARAKLHSTFGEAIEMGQKMNADFTVLTHFSQRYCKIPIFNNRFDEKVGVAFDNMEICLNDLPKLHLFNPVLNTIFDEEVEEMEFRVNKRRKLALLDDRELDML